MGIFARIKKAWYDSIIWETIDEDFYDELEESLIMADLGASVAADAVKELRKVVYEKSIQRGDDVKQALRDILEKKLEVGDTSLDLSTTPSVVLIIGVNGVGKTTSIGKLANRYKKQGKRVLLCAADTFRAAAADQLEIWADRAGVEIVRSREGADPGAVLFDSLQAAKARNVDVVFCDTAGRRTNKANPDAGAGKAAQDHRPRNAGRPPRRRCSCSTRPRGRTACSRRRCSARRRV